MFKQSSTSLLAITFIIFLAYTVFKIIINKKTEYGANVSFGFKNDSFLVETSWCPKIHEELCESYWVRPSTLILNLFYPTWVRWILRSCSCICLLNFDYGRSTFCCILEELLQAYSLAQNLPSCVHDCRFLQYLHWQHDLHRQLPRPSAKPCQWRHPVTEIQPTVW